MDRISRHKRIRSKVGGTAECPRFSVFKSNEFVYVQVVDDNINKTLLAGDTRKIKERNSTCNKSNKIAELKKTNNKNNTECISGIFLFKPKLLTYLNEQYQY